MAAKILIAYYSRTGLTKKIADKLQEKLGCEVEEIISSKKRSGVVGYLFSGKEATQKKAAEIQPTLKNPADYDLVIIGTPIWSWNLSSPVRAYLMQNADRLKRVAVFCTMGGSGDKTAFSETEKICGYNLLASASFLSKEIVAGKFEAKLEKFAQEAKASELIV
jgi:flavodoxin